MPINLSGQKRRRMTLRGAAGYTLIELLIVLLIIGIVSGAIGFSMSIRKESVAIESERLLALLRSVQQEAMLSGSEAAVAFHAGGYVFLRRENNHWLPMSEGLYRPRFLDEDLRLTLSFPENGDGPVRLPVLSRQDGLAGKANFEIFGNDMPRVYFSPGGEVTPFVLALNLASRADVSPISLGFDMQGPVRIDE